MAYYRLDQLVYMLAVFSPTDQNYLDKMRKLINVDEALQAAGVNLGGEDLVYPAPSEKVADGDNITVRTSKPVLARIPRSRPRSQPGFRRGHIRRR